MMGFADLLRYPTTMKEMKAFVGKMAAALV